MARRRFTVDRYTEIERRLTAGRSVREIARALGCSRRTVREVRDGLRTAPGRATGEPLWMAQVDWPAVLHEVGLGHPLKFIWEERAQPLTTYPNFWKQFYRKFPDRKQASVTARDFAPGERVEVDYAGDPLEWVEVRTGELHRAWVFVAGLGCSQLLFAWAADDMKSRNWLDCHQRLYAFYGGVPHVTVPDCLKQGVLKCHRYDPDLNPSYAALAAHYATAVVPARPAHPRDKAIVEGLVKILLRYLRFRYRGRRFTSLAQINAALAVCVERINDRRHRRFGVSRRERFEALERAALKPLPLADFDTAEWKDATLHPDCYVAVEAAYYSAPHIHRGKRLRVRLTANQVELFLNGERLAVHPRDRSRTGRRVRLDAHFPDNALAYYEATPQRLLSQARFLHPDLHQLVGELFSADVYGQLRRVQGLLRTATKHLQAVGHDAAVTQIGAAVATLRRLDKIRVPFFAELLARPTPPSSERERARTIVRRPGNPLLRYATTVTPAVDPVPPTPESLL
jgi:Mu transposase, C-terminal domain